MYTLSTDIRLKHFLNLLNNSDELSVVRIESISITKHNF